MNYWRVESASPSLKVADVEYNTEVILNMAKDAASRGVRIQVFPELALTGYTCGDLFSQTLLLDSVKKAISRLADELPRDMLVVAGAPLTIGPSLYNCGVCFFGGRVVNLAVKTFLPNYKEFYERRWFHSADELITDVTDINGDTVPINFLMQLEDNETGDTVKIGVEICEDLWVAIPPSCRMSIEGAELILNLSASNEVVGKRRRRRSLVLEQSVRCIAAYAFAAAGADESTTDTVFAGDCYIAENGHMLTEGTPFHMGSEAITADVDVERLRQERAVNVSFGEYPGGAVYDTVNLYTEKKQDDLLRTVDPAPFIPKDSAKLRERCLEITEIQTMGLVKRLRHIGCENVVIGISGGLDSTLALLVSCRAFDTMGLPRKGIHGITMPGLGTSETTKNLATRLMEALEVDIRTISIAEATRQHFKDIGHPEDVFDSAYENAQARERTQVLMDYANMVNGLVVGTGDLSELALGWCTFNGDHMAMYGVNAGVPKTLVRYLVRGYEEILGESVGKILAQIVDIPISPELLPADAKGDIAQKTEDIIGPYELHDFFLYHMIRYGEPPAKIFRQAKTAFDGVYDEAVIKKWLVSFYRRFFISQFKRSSLPDGPKVGPVALSPRGDWRMPSDASFNLWLKEAEAL